MSGKLRRWFVPLGAAAVLFGAADPAVAGGVLDPAPVSPNQAFVGQVNGVAGLSRIAVVCDGPADIVPTGHPAAGQTVTAVQVRTGDTTLGVGFTGSAGTAIVVGIGSSVSPLPPVTLRFFQANAAIPTNVLVPCTGTGVVSFTPTLTSATARTAATKVTFVRAVSTG
ncbi:hypothetical protein Dvina_29575 [Dactylosporangium vinaceum]|uniref:Secreted protein n=1 Tax=Dactylosporangium vinaceum TaxID=53362 RepID=A0ABV5ME61_9ACTN|nr:hypothetical protein [Dactylosporangium vinaceum]UAB92497.1 hypothetical protein Dvina_29575 [Dactylosporangium vinaceum]